MNINKPLIVMSLCAAFIAAMASTVVSQSPGLLPPGFVIGNGSSVNPSALAPYSQSAILDQALSSVSGSLAARGAPSGGGGVWAGRTLVGTDIPAATGANRGGVFTTDFRPILTAGRTYFVRTDGSDSNDCLSNSAGGACLTIQHAVDLAVAVDNGGFTITISVQDGTYTGQTVLKRAVGSGVMQITGNTGTPANVAINTTGTSFTCGSCGAWTIAGMKTTTSTAGAPHILVSGGGAFLNVNNWNFGTSNAAFHTSVTIKGQIVFNTDYTISGGGAGHALLSQGGFTQIAGRTITLTGTPAWSNAFVAASQAAVYQANGNTYSGAATGARCAISENAVVTVGGGGATYFPGNSGCAAPTTGGQYN